MVQWHLCPVNANGLHAYFIGMIGIYQDMTSRMMDCCITRLSLIMPRKSGGCVHVSICLSTLYILELEGVQLFSTRIPP